MTNLSLFTPVKKNENLALLGNESWHYVSQGNGQWIEYEYTHKNGRIFGCTGRNLKECYKKREAWIGEIEISYALI